MIYRFSDFELDTSLFELRKAGAVRPVEPQVFDLLRLLVEHRDRVVTREELFETMWPGRFISDAALSSRLKAARKALGDSGQRQSLIRTVHGRGFRFVGEATEENDSTLVAGPTQLDRGAPPEEWKATLDRTSNAEPLEREAALDSLARLLECAARGEGRIALIMGEAGIGKSTLVDAFCSRQTIAAVFTGACDALSTPRPLGPLKDIARAAGDALPSLLETTPDREEALTQLLNLFQGGRSPAIIWIEDIHWADEASLDILISFGRRIGRLSALLILTFRSDEVGPTHPLRRLLAGMPPASTVRIPLEPLSLDGVACLAAGRIREAERIHDLTGGNPFFVTEILASPSGPLPMTVRDAVVGRVATLSAAAREIIELIAVSPRRLSIETLFDLRPESADAIDEALESGTVRYDGRSVYFRHELARRSIEESLMASRKRHLNREMLDYLLGDGHPAEEDLAAIIHHARAAGDRKIVLEFAPRAAVAASATGAHLESAEHYRLLLEHEADFEPTRLAEILEGLSFEVYLTQDIEEAIAARKRALELRRAAGQLRETGADMRWMSRLHWFAGHNEEARHFAAQSVALLETQPPCRELAMAFSNRSQLAMLDDRLEETVRWADRAIRMAEDLRDEEVLAHALTNKGTVWMTSGDPSGEDLIRMALQISLRNNFHEHAVRAWTNIGVSLLESRHYDRALGPLREALEYCDRHDLEAWRGYLKAYLMRGDLDRGMWEKAHVVGQELNDRTDLPAISRISALACRGLLLARRGVAGHSEALDEALTLAKRTAELQRIAPVAAARAEAAWLQGLGAAIAEEAAPAFQLACERDRPWIREQLGYWMWKSGATVEVTDPVSPFGLQSLGMWKEAARRWQEVGCPWEQAMALAEGDRGALDEAVTIMLGLGSDAGAKAVRRQSGRRGR